MRRLTLLRGLLGAAFAVAAPEAASACTVATANTNLGTTSTFAAASAAQQASGSAGLSCDILLAALTTHYVGLCVEASSFQLTGPGGATIGFAASLAPGGPALGVGSFQDLSSFSLVSLFAGAGGSIPIYVRTTPTASLPAGTYTGSLDLRWYYSVCSLGVAVCLAYSASPGFVRPVPLVTSLNWGSGTAVRINISLILEKDCLIDAPAIDFGAAPLVGSFAPVTQTLTIRCSAGAAYSVGLDNGAHAAGAQRRMTNGSAFLAYEILKGAASPDRWGPLGAERRSSGDAEINAGVYNGLAAQGFTYRARIDGAQPTPPAGSYSDTVRVDIEF